MLSMDEAEAQYHCTSLWHHQMDDGQLPLSATGIEKSKGGAGVERIDLQSQARHQFVVERLFRIPKIKKTVLTVVGKKVVRLEDSSTFGFGVLHKKAPRPVPTGTSRVASRP